MALNRIKTELCNMQKENNENCFASPISDEDIFNWKATIIGPPETPYESGIFHLSVKLSADYPFKPPIIRFKTKIFHPNINPDGQICLDMLKDNWSPALTIHKVLLSISSMLVDPNPDDPLYPEAANMYKKNRQEYNAMARSYVVAYAKEWEQK